jgi:hypothetical protein
MNKGSFLCLVLVWTTCKADIMLCTIVMLRFNVQDDGVYDWMILMEEQNKMRDVRPGYRLLPKGFVPPDQNSSSVAANHHPSVNQSTSVANEGSQQLGSPTSYAMSPMVREVNTSRTDTPQRVTPLPASDYRSQQQPQASDGRRPTDNRYGNNQQQQSQRNNAKTQQVTRKKPKWWQRLFRWCHKGSDTDSHA